MIYAADVENGADSNRAFGVSLRRHSWVSYTIKCNCLRRRRCLFRRIRNKYANTFCGPNK